MQRRQDSLNFYATYRVGLDGSAHNNGHDASREVTHRRPAAALKRIMPRMGNRQREGMLLRVGPQIGKAWEHCHFRSKRLRRMLLGTYSPREAVDLVCFRNCQCCGIKDVMMSSVEETARSAVLVPSFQSRGDLCDT